MAWKDVGEISPSELKNARLQLHWASQVVASIGFTFASPEPDWSHTSLTWNNRRGMLMGTRVGSGPTQAGLDLAGLEIALVRNSVKSSFRLRGSTLEDAYGWLLENASGLEPTGSSATLIRPEHEMPDHPIASGSPFDAAESHCAELSKWFRNASHVLTRVARNQHHASPVRCWPHHFDIATLISLDPGVDSEEARSIGVGLSPGDGGTAEPYFYVTPWPYPDAANLPALPIGEWNTDGWVGAVLAGGDLLDIQGSRQVHSATMFIDAAVAASRRLLETA